MNKQKQRGFKALDGHDVFGVSSSSDNLAEKFFITTDENASKWHNQSLT